ncbi:MAG: hypothetical protein WA549_03065 [Thermoplasmata archaeon]
MRPEGGRALLMFARAAVLHANFKKGARGRWRTAIGARDAGTGREHTKPDHATFIKGARVR